MDEKTQKESEAQTKPESSGHTDSAPAKDDIEQNTITFERVASEPESIGSEMKAIPNHAIDKPKTTKPFDKTDEGTGQESEGPDKEREHEALPSDSNNIIIV